MGVLGWRLQKCGSCQLYRWYERHMLDMNKRRTKNPLLTGLSTMEVMGDLDESCFVRVEEGH